MSRRYGTYIADLLRFYGTLPTRTQVKNTSTFFVIPHGQKPPSKGGFSAKKQKTEKTQICGDAGVHLPPVAAGKVQNKMGKGNRSRTQRAVDVLDAPSAAAKKSASKTNRTIAITTAVVSLVLVFFICISVITSTGLLNKMRTAVKSEHIDVNGVLMNYFYAAEYQSFMQYYSSVIDTKKPLHEQKIGDGDTTYADYLMSTVSAEVKQLVTLYNEAIKREMKLTDEEKKDIDEAIKSIESQAALYGYTTSGYLSTIYGNGTNESTLRKAMELQTLASNCYTAIQDEIKAGITEEKINKYYTEHETDFLTADTLQYIFTITLDTGDDAEATDEQKKAYEDEKKAKKALAEKLIAATSEEEFKKIAIDVICEDLDAKAKLATYYTKAIGKYSMTDPEAYKTMKDEDIEQAIAYVKEHMADDEISKEEIVEEGDVTDATRYNTACIDSRYSLLDELRKEYITLAADGVAYADPEGEKTSDIDKWIFNKDRAVNDTTIITSEGDTTTKYTAVIVTRTSSRDESLTKNVAHILFQTGEDSKYETDDDAKAKAEEILEKYKSGEQTLDAFKKLGEEYTDDGSVTYDNVSEGEMVAEFNDWLFDENRKEGDVEIVKTTYGYHIMYFVGDGEEFWYNSAKEDVINSEFDAWNTEAAKTFGVTLNEDTLSKICAQY